MKFKISAEEYEKLSEALKSVYVKSGNGYQLQVEGLEDDADEAKKKVKEFRDNNIRLQRELEELRKQQEKFKDIDPEKYAELSEQAKRLRELEEQNLIKAGDLDKVLAQRTETMRQDYQRQFTAMQNKLESEAKAAAKYRDSYRSMRLRNDVTGAVAKFGALRPGAEIHIHNMAERLWDLDEDGNLVGKDLYAEDGKTPMTVEDWGKRLVTEHPYLFESAQGGGAGGGNRTPTRNNNGVKVLDKPTPADFGRNLESIASGKINVNI